ncbi:MAG: hypothetical protein GWP17_02925 [Aquificales bacterium]|nr:hypothetical protein [Aquificales bacterium]
MADVYTVTFIIIGILISLPALLIGLNLLMPVVTIRTQVRLRETPGKSFWLGAVLTAVLLLIILVTVQIPGPGQAFGMSLAIASMGLGTLGAAGMARLLAERIRPLAKPNSDMMNLLRGAVVYELACLVPFVGWFIFAPLVGMTVMGAAVFALVGWMPKPVFREQATVNSVQ